jgi:hypothetical protein
MRKDLRAQLENASEKVGVLESKLLELKLENDSLKLTPTISDDVDCPECDAWLNEIKVLNEKNASTLAKLDALRTEYDELKARPTLLGACKSCPTMHAKLVDARSTISTLEGSLKSPVVNACMLTVKIRQPSHEFTFGIGMTFVSYPLVLTPVV